MNFTQAIHYDEIPVPVDDRNPTYCPPDLWRGFQISDKWDIWSLGCLYLGFVTYLIFGYWGIAEFRDQRLGRVTDVGFPHSRRGHSPFYSPNYETINNLVIGWVSRLKRSPRCSAIIDDLLNLILQEMLVIDPGVRANANAICILMTELLELARVGENYLLSSENRDLPEDSGDELLPQRPTRRYSL
jgi:serine/threonine protein kinase